MILFYNIHVLSNLPKIGRCTPPPPGVELGSEMHQVSEVNECILQSTPLPFQHMMLWLTRKLVNFNFKWIFEICRWKFRKKFFFTYVRFELVNVPPPPQNQKFFLSKVKFELADVPPPHPPPPGLKKSSKNEMSFWIKFNF